MRLLIEKELKSILQSPKFIGTFAVFAILILMSIYIGIQEYRAAVRQYERASQLAEQELRERTSLGGLNVRVHRKPDPMQIFASGVHNDIGRSSNVNAVDAVKLTHSVYSDDPIFAVFRFVDSENGTLKLVFSNALPRAKYVLAKFIGSWLGLIVPLLIPILLGLLLILLHNIPMTSDHWARVSGLLGASFLYLTFFVAFGILVSTLTRRASVSFLTALVAWVAFVLIIPRAGTMAAAQLVPVPSAAEIEGQQDGFAKVRWQQHMAALEQRWQKRNAEMAGMTEAEQEAHRDAHLWNWMEEDDAARRQTQREINEFSRKLHEDLRHRRAQQERLALGLSRFSPAAAFQLTAMNLAGTNIDLKTRYEDALQTYRTWFTDYRDKKEKETGGRSGVRVTISSETGLQIDTGRDRGTLDLSDMPRFDAPDYTLKDAFGPIIADFGLLALYTLAAFAGAFVRFLRHDVR